MIYTKTAIDSYALYSAVKIIDFEKEEYYGWLVPDPYDINGYMLLPFDYEKPRVCFKRTHINEVYHLTNGIKIPRGVR